jgi:hypothetical protein
MNDPTVSGPDFETFTDGAGYGDQVIYRVASALWDLLDNTKDGYDQYSFGFGPIWDILFNENNSTFSEFWSSWISRDHDRCHGVACLYQNKIDYNSKPFFWGWPFNMPDKRLCESDTLDNTIDLWKHVFDWDCHDDQLTYKIIGYGDPRSGVSIDGNRYIDINPLTNWSGVSNITLEVSDGIESDTETFKVEVEDAYTAVNSPNGGENLLAGCNYDITWNSHCILGEVKLEYSTDGGRSWSKITSSTANDGIYSWTVPNIGSSNCKVKVSDVDGDPYDISNSNFTIKSIVAPSGTYANKIFACSNESYIINWGSVEGATSYEVSENGAWSDVGNVTSKEYSKSSSGDYTYRVRAENGCGAGAESNPVTVKIKSVADIAGIQLNPNPFVPARGHSQITFFGGNLPNSRIEVYDKAARLVATLSENTGSYHLDWYPLSDDGQPLASGVYIWVAKDNSGKILKGKFGIIR